MYEAFYGLRASPFQLNPDPSFFFGSRGHTSAYSYLKFGIYQGEGFVVVTGEIGAGKTTLVRTLLAELDPNEVIAAQLVSTQLDGNDLLRSVAAAFGLPIKSATKAELIATIEAFLTLLVGRKQRALLIVDEAQNLSPEAIEELRMLSNFQFGNKPMLQSFLVGQPELREKLRAPAMEQLRQRILASYHLGPIDEPETRAYIEHRLTKAGWTGDPSFSPDAFTPIYAWSRGLPRKINLLCNRLLLAGFLAEKHAIGVEDVNVVVDELRTEVSGAAGTSFEPPLPTVAPAPVPRPADPARAATATTPPPQGTPRTVESTAPRPARRSANVVPLEATKATLPKPLGVHEEPRAETPSLATMRRAGKSLPLTKPGVKYGPIVCAVGTRPTFVKMAPLIRAIEARHDLPHVVLVHTGQHYDYAMTEQLFADLELRTPDFDLEVGSASNAVQTADTMRRFEAVLVECAPSAVIVAGNCNSSLACALTAAKMTVPVVHVDAGLRCFDRTIPEELNGVLIDQMASLLLTTEHDAAANLAREGIAPDRVTLVGNVGIDAALAALPNAVEPDEVMRSAGVDPIAIHDPVGFGVATLHRARLVDDRDALASALRVLRQASDSIPLVWPMHPRTRARIEQFGLRDILESSRILSIPPQGYLEMIGLITKARVILTDSSGLQDETTAFGIPCLTLRQNTDRPVTVEQGTNVIVGVDQNVVLRTLTMILHDGGKRGRRPEYWDGHTSERIATRLVAWLQRADKLGKRAHA